MLRYSKSFLKRILLNPRIERVSRSLYGHTSYNIEDIHRAVLPENGYIFTQPKTGTNYIKNVLSFYNSQLIGEPYFDFDRSNEFGVITNFGTSASHFAHAINFSRNANKLYLIGHKFYDSKTQHTIVTTRNILDFLVSNFYFSFRNRTNSDTLQIDDVIGRLLDDFIERHENQKRAMQNAKNATVVRYEELLNKPEKTFEGLIDTMYGAVDPDFLAAAIDAASIAKIQKMEQKTGEAAFAGNDTYTGKSFIRSGKTGEGENFFSKKQRKYIEDRLSKYNIPVSGEFH